MTENVTSGVFETSLLIGRVNNAGNKPLKIRVLGSVPGHSASSVSDRAALWVKLGLSSA